MFLYFVLLFHCVFVFCFFVIHGADGECIVTTVVTKKKLLWLMNHCILTSLNFSYQMSKFQTVRIK